MSFLYHLKTGYGYENLLAHLIITSFDSWIGVLSAKSITGFVIGPLFS